MTIEKFDEIAAFVAELKSKQCLMEVVGHKIKMWEDDDVPVDLVIGGKFIGRLPQHLFLEYYRWLIAGVDRLNAIIENA